MSIENPNLLERIKKLEEKLVSIKKRLETIERSLNRAPYRLRSPPIPEPIRPRPEPGPGPKPEPFRF
ncbi:hypothetical protein ES703_91848 [subsurface metagenome]